MFSCLSLFHVTKPAQAFWKYINLFATNSEHKKKLIFASIKPWYTLCTKMIFIEVCIENHPCVSTSYVQTFHWGKGTRIILVLRKVKSASLQGI